MTQTTNATNSNEVHEERTFWLAGDRYGYNSCAASLTSFLLVVVRNFIILFFLFLRRLLI